MGKDRPWRRTDFGEGLTMEKCTHLVVSLAVAARGGFADIWSLKESLCLLNLHCHMVPPLEGSQGSGTCGNRRNLNHEALASRAILCFA